MLGGKKMNKKISIILSLVLVLFAIISIIVPAISITTTSSLDNTKDTTNIYLYDIVGGVSLVGGSITTFTIMSLLVPCLIILCAVGVIFDNKVIKFVLATIALVLVIYFAILHNRCQDLVDKDSTSETLSLAGIIMLTVSLTLDLLGYVIIEYFDKIVTLINSQKSVSLEDRLNELNSLKEKDLITEDEYLKLRSEALNEKN